MGEPPNSAQMLKTSATLIIAIKLLMAFIKQPKHKKID